MSDENVLNLISKADFEAKVNFLGDKIEEAAIPYNAVERIILALTAIANRKQMTNEETFKVGSWETVQTINRLGLTRSYFDVGTNFQAEHTVHGVGQDKLIDYRICGIDYEYPCKPDGTPLTTKDVSGKIIPAHSITLETVNCLPTKYKWHRSADNTYYQVTNGVVKQADHRALLNTSEIVSSEYSTDRGFLYGFDPELLAVIGYCAKTTVRNSGLGGQAIITTERIFLPSMNETFIGYNSGYAEGAVGLSRDTTVDPTKFYCTNNEGVVTKITDIVSGDTRNPSELGWYEVRGAYEFYSEYSSLPNIGSGADSNRIKKVGSNVSDWYLRSVYRDSPLAVMRTMSGGNLDNDGTNVAKGISPTFCIV